MRATGTRFAVDRREHDVIVTVEEGTVLVSDGKGRSGAVSLTAAEQLKISGAWPPVARHVDAARELAWSNRRLVFENDTVAAAAEEFNRRNRVQLIVDPALGSAQVRGVFHADDPASFVDSLATKGIVLRESRDIIRLLPRPAVPPPAARPAPP